MLKTEDEMLKPILVLQLLQSLKGAGKTVFWQTEELTWFVPHNERVLRRAQGRFLYNMNHSMEIIVIINKFSSVCSSKDCQLELLTSERAEDSRSLTSSLMQRMESGDIIRSEASSFVALSIVILKCM